MRLWGTKVETSRILYQRQGGGPWGRWTSDWMCFRGMHKAMSTSSQCLGGTQWGSPRGCCTDCSQRGCCGRETRSPDCLHSLHPTPQTICRILSGLQESTNSEANSKYAKMTAKMTQDEHADMMALQPKVFNSSLLGLCVHCMNTLPMYRN